MKRWTFLIALVFLFNASIDASESDLQPINFDVWAVVDLQQELMLLSCTPKEADDFCVGIVASKFIPDVIIRHNGSYVQISERAQLLSQIVLNSL